MRLSHSEVRTELEILRLVLNMLFHSHHPELGWNPEQASQHFPPAGGISVREMVQPLEMPSVGVRLLGLTHPSEGGWPLCPTARAGGSWQR